MRRLLLGLVLASPALAAGEGPNSRVTAVTVYEDRALVTRSQAVTLAAGRSVVRFTGLPAGLDERTLRAGLDGPGRVVGISTSVTRTVAPADERVHALEAGLEALQDLAAAKDEALAALAVERRYVEAFRAFAKAACSEGTSTADPKASTWVPALAFLRERDEAASRKAVTIESERRELAERAQEAMRKLEQARSGDERLERTAEVAVESESGGQATATCSYHVGGASWSPVYDARFDPASKAIGFGCFGAVRQKTGEEWPGVRLTLSTARPSVGAERPQLMALQLTGHKREHRKEVDLSFGFASREMAPASAAPKGGESAPAESPAPLSVVQDRGPSVTFEITNPATIPEDGRPHRVAVAEATLKPELSFESVPKLRPYAYLKALQPNPTGIPLLAGPVHIFRASGYVGTADLKFTAPGEPLALSLGVDEAVRVLRKIVRETEEEGQGMANRRVLTRAYDLEVENHSGAPQTVRLLDQVPVSRLEAVEVRLAESTTKPDARDEEGILTWNLALANGEKRTVHLEFTVTMPAGHRLAP